MAALESWKVRGLPDNPSAWLFRVAHINAMRKLPSRSGRRRILERNPEDGCEVSRPRAQVGSLTGGEGPDRAATPIR